MSVVFTAISSSGSIAAIDYSELTAEERLLVDEAELALTASRNAKSVLSKCMNVGEISSNPKNITPSFLRHVDRSLIEATASASKATAENDAAKKSHRVSSFRRELLAERELLALTRRHFISTLKTHATEMIQGSPSESDAAHARLSVACVESVNIFKTIVDTSVERAEIAIRKASVTCD